MAASSNSAPATLIFQGPAGQNVDSFQILCTESLDYSNPRWKDYNDPQSSITPPIITYKNSNKSDKDVDSHLRQCGDTRESTDRRSDSAEHLIHMALCELSDEKDLAPFITIQGADLSSLGKERSPYLRLLPAHLSSDPSEQLKYKDGFREYDMIVIGPKVGFIVIEVKGSSFTPKRDTNKHGIKPSDEYIRGMKQAKTGDTLLAFLHSFAGFLQVSIVAKKILFVPNVERERYDRWFSSLNDPKRHEVLEVAAGIDQWYRDEANVLKSTLKSLMTNSGGIPVEVYESLAPIIAGLASVIIFRSSVKVDPSQLRQSDAVYRESWRVHQQDPLEEHYPMEKQHPVKMKHLLEKAIRRINADIMDVKYFTTIIFAPEQSAALKQLTNQHLIIGAAGVGKTLILQAKALELLAGGKSVLILTSEKYGEKYKTLLNLNRPHTSFRAEKWKDIARAAGSIFSLCDRYTSEIVTATTQSVQLRMIQIMEDILRTCVDQNLEMTPADENELEELLRRKEYTRRDFVRQLTGALKRLVRVFRNTDCILIDDSYDGEQYNTDILDEQLAIISLMVMNMRMKAQKLLWIALDPYSEFCATDLRPKRHCRLSFLDEDGPYKNAFEITYLNRVLRCPETVYDVCYGEIQNLSCSYASNDPKRSIKPELGHKILGLHKPIEVEEDFDSASEHIRTVLGDFDARGYSYDKMAVITVEEGPKDTVWRRMSVLIKDHLRTILRSKGFDGKSLEDEVQRATNVFTCYQVSSMEWPVVIVIVHGTKRWLEKDCAYRLYRACSRATGKLTVIRMIRRKAPESSIAPK